MSPLNYVTFRICVVSQNINTHKDDLVVKDHCSISSVDKGAGIETTLFGKQGAFFQNRGNIPSPLADLMLACC
jgi:hypothetical protein